MYSVLIVEDEEIIRKGLIMSIEFEKFDCVLIGEANNGKEGVDLIKKCKPDIVITDITMPLMSGIEMIEHTLDYDYTSIIISGYNEFSFAKKAIRLGVSDYLLKPIDKKELEKVIMQVIEHRKVLKYYKAIIKKKGEIADIQLLDEVIGEDTLVNDMILYIKNHYMDKISMLDVSKYLNYSESLLAKRFKQYTNLTFNDYVNRFRVQKAIEYIKLNTYNMYQIADISGFSDYKYFSVVFKKYTGCSPKQFIDIAMSNTH